MLYLSLTFTPFQTFEDAVKDKQNAKKSLANFKKQQ